METKRTSGPVTTWHGFNVQEFDEIANELLKQVEPLQRHLAAMKATLSDANKRGTVSSFTETDASTKLGAACANLREEIAPGLKNVEAIEKCLSQWRAAERGSRRPRFEGLAKDHGWKVMGNWPEPVIGGVVFLVVEDSKDKATVNGRPFSGLPTAERLAAHVETELKDLERHKTDPEKFIAELWQAYASCDGKVSEGVLVFDLLREMMLLRQSKKFQRDPDASHFRSYPVAQFRADLTAYLAAGSPPVRDGSKQLTLEVVGGSFAENGLFMYFPQTDRLATCGRLTFRQAGE
jgi:hypothetical protein